MHTNAIDHGYHGYVTAFAPCVVAAYGLPDWAITQVGVPTGVGRQQLDWSKRGIAGVTTVVKRSPVSCIEEAYARLSGAVGVVLHNPTIDPALWLDVLKRAYHDAELLATGGNVIYLHGRCHSAPAESSCNAPPWNAIPG